ncbi:hypothetical protein AWH66_2012220 [Vibrio barjaei]|nr:hypothetical protein AWH66_2012220 [Vibrio barjaei]
MLNRSYFTFFRGLGPGILMASAAVGGSHLVASTQAGALYGWQLAGLILLVNLFKYPFIYAGTQFTASSGKSLVEGYFELGRRHLLMFFIFMLISSFINTAALMMFSASLLEYFFPFAASKVQLFLGVLIVTCIVLITGKYKALDFLSKMTMLILTLTTVFAVTLAFQKYSLSSSVVMRDSPWTIGAIGFLIITMGWMPAPIEISTLTSMWLKKKVQHQDVEPHTIKTDFHVGYISTIVLALVFLSLGALVFKGSEDQMIQGSVGFTHQLVNLYSSVTGDWSKYIIALIAFLCIYGSAITILDGYGRVLSESFSLLVSAKSDDYSTYYIFWILFVSTGAGVIVVTSIGSLKDMLHFTMIAAFLMTPVFAWLNYRVLNSTELNSTFRVTYGLNLLTKLGFIYLVGFCLLFVMWLVVGQPS